MFDRFEGDTHTHTTINTPIPDAADHARLLGELEKTAEDRVIEKWLVGQNEIKDLQGTIAVIDAHAEVELHFLFVLNGKSYHVKEKITRFEANRITETEILGKFYRALSDQLVSAFLTTSSFREMVYKLKGS